MGVLQVELRVSNDGGKNSDKKDKNKEKDKDKENGSNHYGKKMKDKLSLREKIATEMSSINIMRILRKK